MAPYELQSSQPVAAISVEFPEGMAVALPDPAGVGAAVPSLNVAADGTREPVPDGVGETVEKKGALVPAADGVRLPVPEGEDVVQTGAPAGVSSSVMLVGASVLFVLLVGTNVALLLGTSVPSSAIAERAIKAKHSNLELVLFDIATNEMRKFEW